MRRFDRPANIDRAIQAFENAIQQDAGYAAAYAGLAEAYVRKNGASPDAQWLRLGAETARKAVELNPDLAMAHRALGMVLLQSGKGEEGAAELRRALELDPLDSGALTWLGEYYYAKGQSREAEEAYRKAMKLRPDDWTAPQALGRFLYKNARYAEAASAWEQARSLTPDNISVLRNLAAAYHMLDRYDEAAAVLQRALEVDCSAPIYNNLGTARFFQGHYSEAASAFEKAVELNANNYLYWGNLGDAYRWMPGKSAKAQEAYLRARQLVEEKLAAKPDDAEMRSSLAVYCAKTGDKACAITEAARVEALPKPSPGSRFKCLIAYEVAGHRKKALAALEQTVGAGYSLREIRNEPELVSLRADPRYHRIVLKAQPKSSNR